MGDLKQRVQEVKARHRQELMALRGVQAVGLGDDHGLPVITVYVDYLDLQANAQIPNEIEGVRVVIEESGAFEAS